MGGFDPGVGAFGVGTSCGGDADEPHPVSSIAHVIRTMTRLSLVAAFKVLRLLWISLSLVVRMLGIRTQRTAPSGKRATRRSGCRRRSLLDPIHERRQQIEAVQRSFTTVTVPHPWSQIQTAPVVDDGRATIGLGHALVVVDRIERREPRIAHAVEEDQLATMAGER